MLNENTGLKYEKQLKLTSLFNKIMRRMGGDEHQMYLFVTDADRAPEEARSGDEEPTVHD